MPNAGRFERGWTVALCRNPVCRVSPGTLRRSMSQLPCGPGYRAGRLGCGDIRGSARTDFVNVHRQCRRGNLRRAERKLLVRPFDEGLLRQCFDRADAVDTGRKAMKSSFTKPSNGTTISVMVVTARRGLSYRDAARSETSRGAGRTKSNYWSARNPNSTA